MSEEAKTGRVVIGFILLSILVVGLVGLVVLGLSEDDDGAVDPLTSVAVPSPVGQPDDIYAAACGYEPIDRASPTAEFATTRVVTGAGVAVASADGIGPCSLDPVPYGYAFTPKGALLAAVNFMVAMSDHPVKTDVAEYQMADGQMRSEILASSTTLPVAPGRIRVVGFKMEMLGSFEYRVDVAFTSGAVGDRVAAASLVVVWEDHDWRVVMPAGGLDGYPVTDLRIEGFHVWGF